MLNKIVCIFKFIRYDYIVYYLYLLYHCTIFIVFVYLCLINCIAYVLLKIYIGTYDINVHVTM